MGRCPSLHPNSAFFRRRHQAKEASCRKPRPSYGLSPPIIPARLERLLWGRFHSLVVIALGITWALDGLEVTLAGAVAGALKDSPSLALSNAQVGLAASFYLAGAVLGALFFGWLTDRLGRKRLFSITLGLYLVATAATALSWDFYSSRSFDS
jgi:MFS family permease